MPTGQDTSRCDPPPQEQQQSQIKLCSSCQSPVDQANLLYLPEADAIVCALCRERILSARSPTASPEGHPFHLDVDGDFTMRHDTPTVIQSTRRIQVSSQNITPILSSPSTDTSISHQQTLTITPTYVIKPPLLPITCTTSSFSLPQHQNSLSSITHPPRWKTASTTFPDPLTDITHLRVRSQGHHCLYPGASFQGTQKSGRNSYDVNVTIVDIDFASSFLCGYLRIRGLTDDWPELTTYFDAEIIGSRYGFLTRNWGATEHEDLVHWSRFPAFKHVKQEARKPHMTIDDRERGAIFMRWKERFLVPDHRVQDINGASFAGFYYVCVEFNSQASSSTTRSTSQNLQPFANESIDMEPEANGVKSEAPIRTRRDSSVRRRLPSVVPLSAPVATMSGFYYHQNSEPYQQLSLCHVPERSSSSFEFR